MANPTKLRAYGQRPQEDAVSADTLAWMDWVHTTLNTLVGQNVPPQTGFRSLAPGIVDPTTIGLATGGSRITSIATNFSASAPSTTSIHIFWDGSNSSTILRIYRDDNTVAGPFPGDQLVTGLTANTLYYFYPYFDEVQQRVLFVSQAGAVGTPPIAYPASSIVLSQQQSLRGRIPLSQLGITGFSTPAAGNTPAASTGGGGGGGGIHIGSRLGL